MSLLVSVILQTHASHYSDHALHTFVPTGMYNVKMSSDSAARTVAGAPSLDAGTYFQNKDFKSVARPVLLHPKFLLQLA